MQWFPDPELEKYIREIARLPEMTDEDVDYKRAMLQQQQAVEFAQGQMDLLGTKQKAEMTAQGFSPEQAQMHAEQPTADMAQQYAVDGAKAEQDAEATRRLHPVGQADAMDAQMQMQIEQSREEMKNAPPPADPNEDKRAAREKDKADRDERYAAAGDKREKEKMRLQDQLAERQHKRDIASLREKKKQVGRVTAKKPPPKKGK
jgi:hypothetical protein